MSRVQSPAKEAHGANAHSTRFGRCHLDIRKREQLFSEPSRATGPLCQFSRGSGLQALQVHSRLVEPERLLHPTITNLSSSQAGRRDVGAAGAGFLAPNPVVFHTRRFIIQRGPCRLLFTLDRFFFTIGPRSRSRISRLDEERHRPSACTVGRMFPSSEPV